MAESHLRQEDNSAAARALVASALRTLEAEAGGVAALATAIRDGLGRPFVAAVDRIRAAKGRLIVTGMGKSGHIGRKIAATFASTGTPAFFVHPGEASHGDLGMITPDDLIMALSWSGETAELKNLIDYSRRFRIGLIAMTAEPDSTLGRAADVVLALPQAREACPHNLAPTTSSLMQLALGDALAIALLESRGFTARRLRPPAPGRAARRHAQVRARRHAHGRRPAAVAGRHPHVGSHRRDVGQGLRLRRYHRPRRPARRHHHRRRPAPAHARRPARSPGRRRDDAAQPKTVRPDQLASEALEILNSAKVTALIVVDAGRPVGIVHVHDLLRIGAA